MISCERLAGRCLGLSPLLPAGSEELRAAAPAAPVGPPAVAGPACPGTGLTAPVQDDWCERWVTKRDLGPQGSTEVPSAVTPSPDGSELYVLADRVTLDTFGTAIVVFDAANGVWRHTIPIPYRFLGPDSQFFPYLLAAGPDTIFVGGYVSIREETPEGFARHTNILTAAYSRTGQLRWWSRYQGPMSGKGPDHGEFPANLMLSPDGSQLIVAGVSTRPGDFQRDPIFGRDRAPDDVVLVSYDTATGAERWVERFDSGDLEFPWGLAINPDGSALYVNTMSWEFESTVLAYEGLGGAADDVHLEWSHAEDPADLLAPIAIGATAAGPVVAGLANLSSTVDYGVVALDIDGNVRWRAKHSNVYTIAGTDYTSSDIPMGMVTDGNRVYVTGYAYEGDLLHELGDPSPSMVGSTVAVDAGTGKVVWQNAYRFPGHRIHFPMSLHLAGGSVYVPGVDSECNFYMGPSYYCSSTTINLVTLDYDATTGSLQRVARLNHGQTVAAPGLQPSLPTAPGYNLFARSAVGSGQQLSVVTLFDAPCAYCHPAAQWRMGIVAYGPSDGSSAPDRAPGTSMNGGIDR